MYRLYRICADITLLKVSLKPIYALCPINVTFANTVDPDQMLHSGSTLFALSTGNSIKDGNRKTNQTSLGF